MTSGYALVKVKEKESRELFPETPEPQVVIAEAGFVPETDGGAQVRRAIEEGRPLITLLRKEMVQQPQLLVPLDLKITDSAHP